MTQEFDNKMFRCERYGIIRSGGFLYIQGMQPKLRVPGHKRDIKYISKEELADGLYAIIKQNVSVSQEGLFKALSNLLGFNRVGEATVTRFSKALDILKNKGNIEEENGILHVRD